MTRGTEFLELIKQYESRNITFMDPDGAWPVVWERAQGMYVYDSGGKRYLDLTAAFGVAAAGHANPAVVKSAQEQLAKLPHAMGDVHPHPMKAMILREISRITYERWNAAEANQTVESHSPQCGHAKTILCNSGFEAVESALKTAMLATGRRGVIAFEHAYHGLGYGALNATHRRFFREPFAKQIAEFGGFVPFPTCETELDTIEKQLTELLENSDIGAVIVEPVQGRGGTNIPPRGFLGMLRSLCDKSGALLILDEIYTGFGRTGRWFACEHEGVVPDLICLGKALTGGFPMSACAGRADIMDKAWPPSDGEALHTSTFLGNPVGCAMALAHISEIKQQGLVEHSAEIGNYLTTSLEQLRVPDGLHLSARGLGLMTAIELRYPDGRPATQQAFSIVKSMLAKGFFLLPEGDEGNIISLTPPLIINSSQIDSTITALQDELSNIA
ncbi:MAG: aspartate aminotransferase family protein [Verrucomicrobia bacterium]|nr:aspartate aminotransferase family protein [Verrucomicrobiota bacterium]MCF7708421.1 aspartate aminotransferase family protein [Verrucomicrobiota bacterium]